MIITSEMNMMRFLLYFCVLTEPAAPEIHSDFKDAVFTENRKNITITVGTNATVYGQSVLVLTCNASGSPPPVIHWTRNGRSIMEMHAIQNKLFLTHDPAQSGEYSCVATNFIGKAKLSSNIQFIGKIIYFQRC